MKENYTHLYPNEQVAKAVSDYAYEHSTKLPKHITDHHAWGSEHSVNPGYMISTLQQQFQIWIARAIGAKRILEIGTYIGFSTMGWSEAVGPEGHVTALEFSPEFAKIAEDSFEKHGIKNVEVMVGDARESIKNLPSTLTAPYDLIFIDADKTSYPTYLSLILSLSSPTTTGTRLLRPGGIILADNILRRGLIADSTDANPFTAKAKEMGRWNPADIEAMDAFNKALVGNERFETFLLPLFDGVGCARLKN